MRCTELAELKIALTAATKAGNLDEANAIKAVCDKVAIELAAVSGEPTTLRVIASKPRQSIGHLPAGTYTLTAKRRWNWNGRGFIGPEGSGRVERGYLNLGSLIAKYGETKVVVGERLILQLEEDQEVFFQVDDR